MTSDQQEHEPAPAPVEPSALAAALMALRRRPILGGAALLLCLALLAASAFLLASLRAPAPSAPPLLPAAAQMPGNGAASKPSTPPYTVFAWRDASGVARRGAIDTASYEAFLAGERQQIVNDRRRLGDEQARRLRVALAPVFDEVEQRVPAYADWVFNWWTSWILLARSFGWSWEGLKSGHLVTLPDLVQARLVAAIQEQFRVLVLAPELFEPKLRAALDGSLAPGQAALQQDCAKYEAALARFVRSEARRVERLDPAQGWLPDPNWSGGSASFQPLCGTLALGADPGLRGEFAQLVEAQNASGPVNEVILRMSRPFATKLISFIVLPVIVTAILGGFILPLFALLPNVLSSVIIGVLTGALGAAVIGFSASASVDWLLNRSDEALNRAGFEANVRKAVISAQSDFERGIAEAQRRAIERQLDGIAAALAGRTPSP